MRSAKQALRSNKHRQAAVKGCREAYQWAGDWPSSRQLKISKGWWRANGISKSRELVLLELELRCSSVGGGSGGVALLGSTRRQRSGG